MLEKEVFHAGQGNLHGFWCGIKQNSRVKMAGPMPFSSPRRKDLVTRDRMGWDGMGWDEMRWRSFPSLTPSAK